MVWYPDYTESFRLEYGIIDEELTVWLTGVECQLVITDTVAP